MLDNLRSKLAKLLMNSKMSLKLKKPVWSNK